MRHPSGLALQADLLKQQSHGLLRSPNNLLNFHNSHYLQASSAITNWAHFVLTRNVFLLQYLVLAAKLKGLLP